MGKRLTKVSFFLPKLLLTSLITKIFVTVNPTNPPKGSKFYLVKENEFERKLELLGKVKSIEDIEWKQGLILRFLLYCTDYISSNWRELKGYVRWWTIGLVEGAEISIALDELSNSGFIEIINGAWKLTERGKEWAEKIDYWFLRPAKVVSFW